MARQKGPSEKQVEDAIRVLRADYYSEVRDMGDEFIRAIRDREINNPEEFDRHFHESIDGTRRVIMTFEAMKGVLVSENDDAYFEEGLGDLDCSESIPYSTLMYFAMRADVLEYMQANDVDPFDEDTYEEEEED